MTTFPCAPNHSTGSKPWTVPVAGNLGFVVLHGDEYLDTDGNVTPHPARMTFSQAQAATAAHSLRVSQSHAYAAVLAARDA